MPNRPAAASVAGLDTSLTWIAYESDSADGLHVLHNGQAILTGSIESISVDIDTEKGTLTAILVRKEGAALPSSQARWRLLPRGSASLCPLWKRITSMASTSGLGYVRMARATR